MLKRLRTLTMAVALASLPISAMAGDVNSGVSHSHTTGYSSTTYDSNAYSSTNGNGVAIIRSSVAPGEFNVRREVYDTKGATNDHTVGTASTTFTQDSRSLSAGDITSRTSNSTSVTHDNYQSDGGTWEETEGTYKEKARVGGSTQRESGVFEAWNDSGYETTGGNTTSTSSTNQTVTTDYNR